MSAKAARWVVILAAIILANRVPAIGSLTGPGSA